MSRLLFGFGTLFLFCLPPVFCGRIVFPFPFGAALELWEVSPGEDGSTVWGLGGVEDGSTVWGLGGGEDGSTVWGLGGGELYTWVSMISISGSDSSPPSDLLANNCRMSLAAFSTDSAPMYSSNLCCQTYKILMFLFE